MLTHKAIGPNARGKFHVVYPTPGCNIPTVACECLTRAQAVEEAARLNAIQLSREQAIRNDRQLRGLGGIYPGLRER